MQGHVPALDFIYQWIHKSQFGWKWLVPTMKVMPSNTQHIAMLKLLNNLFCSAFNCSCVCVCVCVCVLPSSNLLNPGW